MDAVEGAEHLDLAGLMVVPPLDADAGEVFRGVRQEVDRLSAEVNRPLKMSAGMSADMAEAIAAGSDIVRVRSSFMLLRPGGYKYRNSDFHSVNHMRHTRHILRV